MAGIYRDGNIRINVSLEEGHWHFEIEHLDTGERVVEREEYGNLYDILYGLLRWRYGLKFCHTKFENSYSKLIVKHKKD